MAEAMARTQIALLFALDGQCKNGLWKSNPIKSLSVLLTFCMNRLLNVKAYPIRIRKRWLYSRPGWSSPRPSTFLYSESSDLILRELDSIEQCIQRGGGHVQLHLATSVYEQFH